MSQDLFSYQAGLPDRINVRVTSNAKANRIKIEHLEDGTKLYRVYVTVIAEKGKANEAVLKLLAKEFGVAKSSLKIVSGEFHKHKVVEFI